MDTTDEQIRRLEERLRDGFDKIGKAMSHGVEVDNWERHWIELLREYERLNDELDAHHAGDAPVMQAELAGMPRKEMAG